MPYIPEQSSAQYRYATVQAVNDGLCDLDFGDGGEIVQGVPAYGGEPVAGERVMVLLQGRGATVLVRSGGGGVPTASIMPYAATAGTPPDGWLYCEGQAVSRTTYADLFAAIGTTYGVGDGSTTFTLPNLKGRVPVGYDTAQTEFNAHGKAGGAKTHTLTVGEMPAHSHAWYDTNTTAAANYAGSGGLQGSQTTKRAALANTGGSGAHNNLQPYISMRYIIKA